MNKLKLYASQKIDKNEERLYNSIKTFGNNDDELAHKNVKYYKIIVD